MKRLYRFVATTCTALLAYNVVFASSVANTVYNNSYNNETNNSVTEFVYDNNFFEYLNDISLSFTSNITIRLNPYKINGEEQVISNDIIIENTGDHPISIKLKRCSIKTDDESEIIFTSDNYLKEDSDLKEAFIYIYEAGESKFNKLSDDNLDMDFRILEKGEKKILKIGGELNTNAVWTKDDRFDIKLIFKFEPLETLNQETVSSSVYN